MAKGKKSSGAGAPYYETGGGLITPIVGLSNGAGFGTPPKPAKRGEPKEPGTGQIPKGGTGPDGGASHAMKAIFGRTEGKRK